MLARLLVTLVAAIGAAGCGESSPGTPTGPDPPPTTILASGQNWSFRLDGFIGAPSNTISPGGLIIIPMYGSNAPLVALEGAFNASAGSVSAVLQAFGRCFNWELRVRFSGTRSGNTIELVSLPHQVQVVRINVTLSAGGDAAQGTYTITGGCGAGSSGPIDGRQVNLTGVWTGMMGSIPARLDMLMADAPDANEGNFGVSGTATFSGTSCFANAVITRRGRGRIVFPDISEPPHHMELIAEVWQDLTAMKVTFGLTQGTCPELAGGSATFVKQ